MRNFFRWLFLPTHRLRRQTWGGCGFAPALLSERYGWIVGVWKARRDTAIYQAGVTYVEVDYNDGGHRDLLPLDCLYYDKQRKLYNFS